MSTWTRARPRVRLRRQDAPRTALVSRSPREESNLCTRVRSPGALPLSYGGDRRAPRPVRSSRSGPDALRTRGSTGRRAPDAGGSSSAKTRWSSQQWRVSPSSSRSIRRSGGSSVVTRTSRPQASTDAERLKQLEIEHVRRGGASFLMSKPGALRAVGPRGGDGVEPRACAHPPHAGGPSPNARRAPRLSPRPAGTGRRRSGGNYLEQAGFPSHSPALRPWIAGRRLRVRCGRRPSWRGFGARASDVSARNRQAKHTLGCQRYFVARRAEGLSLSGGASIRPRPSSS